MKKRFVSMLLIICLLLGTLAGCGQGGGPTSTPTTKTPVVEPSSQVTGIEYDEHTTLAYYEGGSLSYFDQYCADLEGAGMTQAYYRDTESLRCAAYQDGQEYVYAYYAKRTGTMRVSKGMKETFSTGDFKADTGVSVTPTLTMVGQISSRNNGQGFIFVLPDGRLIVQDGGFGYTDDDPDGFYTAIKSVAPDENKVVIAAWFLSHPHDDHVNAFKKFMKEHGNDPSVEVERVVYNFAAPEQYNFDREDGGKERWSQYVIDVNALAGDKAIRAHTGQIFDFGCAQVEILFTAEDMLPAENFGFVNSASMVIRVSVAGQSVLLLADSTSISCPRIEAVFDDALTSDMVQLSHHGMWAGTPTVYFYIRARVLLWPTLPSVAVKWLPDAPVLAAIRQAQDLFVAGTEMTTLQLPYTPVNNKQAVIAEISENTAE